MTIIPMTREQARFLLESLIWKRRQVADTHPDASKYDKLIEKISKQLSDDRGNKN